MKMKYSIWLIPSNEFKIIEAKSEAKAFHIAVGKYGPTGFTGFKRYYEGQNLRDHKLFFLKRAITNITKHIHTQKGRF